MTFQQFDKGEYLESTNREDDLAIITGYIPLRPDTDLEFVRGAGAWQTAHGIIGTSGDVDSYTFTVGARGTYSFEAISGVNLDGIQFSSLYYALRLKNETTGEIVFQKYSPLDTFKVSYEVELQAGVYTLSIAGEGCVKN